MKPKLSFQLIVVPLVMLLAPPSTAIAQGTAFTYQGHLNDGANPAGGTYDLRFTIYDSAGAGNVVAGPVTNSALAISNGLFTVTLDFGPSAFTGADRWLEIAARTNGLGGFATLSPRQKVTATPYAIAAAEVTSANVARLDVSNTTVPATGHPIITSGFITGAVVDNGGSGYTTAPNVVVNDATGSGAIITATVSNGKVASLTVNNAGVNYSPGATLTIGAPPSNAYQIFGSTNFFSGVNRVTNANNVFAGDGSALSGLWRLNGNADTVAGAHFVGTTDNQPIEVKVNNIRALRLEPTTNNASRSNMVNVVAGSPVNFVASGVYAATIAGGGSAGYDGFSTRPNSIASDFGTVGGGSFNRIHTNSFASTIAGGFQNQIIKAFEATIGGGEANRIDGQTASFVEVGSTIGGGTGNTIGVTNFGAFGIIAEGGHVISGGNANRIRTNLVYGTIAGGSANQIHSSSATISGGDNNIIQAGASYSVIAGGQQNTNSGSFGVIPGGHQNVAGGDYSLAGGRRAKANHDGTFVWADSQNSDFASTASNQFLIRASGGVGIGTTDPGDTLRVQGPAALGDLWISPTTGGGNADIFLSETASGTFGIKLRHNGANNLLEFVGVNSSVETASALMSIGRGNSSGVDILNNLIVGGNLGVGTSPTNRLHVAGGVSATAFVNTSDRNAKENFAPVSPQEILSKVATLPISTWNFKTMNDGRHLGPTAQDFHAAFGLGGGDTTITSVDPDGVALAAIQGLNQKLEETRKENAELKQRLAALEKVIREKP